MVNFAVTGANGFIGRHLVPFLRSHGHDAIAMTRTQMEQPDQILSERLRGVSVMVHLAGHAHRVGADAQNADDYYFGNVVLTERILDIARMAGIKRFVFISSIGVNGKATTDHAFHEHDPPAPHNPYAQSKHLAETKVVKFCEENGMEWVILRPPLVYGCGAPGNIATLSRLIALGLPLPFANIKNRRSMVSVENLCAIIALCGTSENAANQLYLASDGFDRATPEFLRMLGALEQRQVRLFSFPQKFLVLVLKAIGQYERFGALWEDLRVDTSKLRQHLGWTGR